MKSGIHDQHIQKKNYPKVLAPFPPGPETGSSGWQKVPGARVSGTRFSGSSDRDPSGATAGCTGPRNIPENKKNALKESCT